MDNCVGFNWVCKRVANIPLSLVKNSNYLLRILTITAVGKGGCNKIITCY